MNRFKARRAYYFREMVAELDCAICKAGQAPMVLPWRKVRALWRIAGQRAAARDGEA